MVVALFFVAFLQISSASTQPQISNSNVELVQVLDEIGNVLDEIVNAFCETEEIADSLEWFYDNCPESKQAALWQFKANEILKMRNTQRRTKYSNPQENETEENRMKTVKKRLLWLKPPKDNDASVYQRKFRSDADAILKYANEAFNFENSDVGQGRYTRSADPPLAKTRPMAKVLAGLALVQTPQGYILSSASGNSGRVRNPRHATPAKISSSPRNKSFLLRVRK